MSDMLSPEMLELMSVLIIAVSGYFGIPVAKKKIKKIRKKREAQK